MALEVVSSVLLVSIPEVALEVVVVEFAPGGFVDTVAAERVLVECC